MCLSSIVLYRPISIPIVHRHTFSQDIVTKGYQKAQTYGVKSLKEHGQFHENPSSALASTASWAWNPGVQTAL